MDLNLNWGFIAVVAIILIALIVFIRCFRIVQQARAFVIERLGAYHATWSTGLRIKIPIIDRVARVVSLKEQILDNPPRSVITKEGVSIEVDSFVYFEVTDPKLYTYGVENPIMALGSLTATTLRNIVGEMELDQTLTSRDYINGKLRTILDEATDPWGIKVTRVEIKSIDPPRDVQESMEKEMRAEREKRQNILRAEGEKQSAILVAQGEKESAILRAEAEKQTAVLRAQGEAEAILAVQTATADGIRKINESLPSDKVIQIRALEAFAAAANGRATKIIIPSEIQGLAGLAAGLQEVLTSPELPAPKAK
ncbi:MAG: SPFH/Band 7/PHB domain protein [Oscillospiraceae bacterium]|nr:SPFH/Band 7/PHB domain protein [Oscillospiraceae bacterium]